MGISYVFPPMLWNVFSRGTLMSLVIIVQLIFIDILVAFFGVCVCARYIFDIGLCVYSPSYDFCCYLYMMIYSYVELDS